MAATRKTGEVPDVDEIRRQALERIRQLKAKGLAKEKPEPLPTAYPELWPGGPGLDTGDIRLAGAGKKRRGRRAAIAAIRQGVA